jgi:acetyl-CoA synthetase
VWHIRGRSDDTLKVAGKRLGPAEVEAAVNAHPGVVESAAIGVPDPIKGEAVVVFARLRDDGAARDEQALRDELDASVTVALGRALRPKAVLFVDDLPRTRSGKILRRVVQATHLGEPAGDISALEDERALDAVRRAR